MMALLFTTFMFVSTLVGGWFAIRHKNQLRHILGFTAGVILGVIAFDVLPELFGIVHVRGDVHTNSIEGLWGNWKKSMSGTYNRVSPKYLQSYLNEFIFRYNNRAIAVCPLLLARAAKRV